MTEEQLVARFQKWEEHVKSHPEEVIDPGDGDDYWRGAMSFLEYLVQHQPTYFATDHWIMCLNCGFRSYNPKDIANRYCGSCHKFHEAKI